MRRVFCTIAALLTGAGIASAQFASAPMQTPYGIAVSDSKGRFVGYLVPSTATVGALVQRKIGTQWVSFMATAKGIVSLQGQIYFTTSDCSGTAYLDASSLPPFG
jgi:hypothetical protein